MNFCFERWGWVSLVRHAPNAARIFLCCPVFDFFPCTAFFSLLEFFMAKREKFLPFRLALGPPRLLSFRSLACRFINSPRAKHGFFFDLLARPSLALLNFPERSSPAFLKTSRRSLIIFLPRLRRSPLDSAKLFGNSVPSEVGAEPGDLSVYRPQPPMGLAHRLPGLAPPARPVAHASLHHRQPSPRSSRDVRHGIV